MDTREMAGEYRLARWAQLTRERLEKGQTIRAYCKEAGIPENTYFYWQRKLREAACTEMLSGPGEERLAVPDGWAQCTQTPAASSEELTVEVGGCRIRVNAATDLSLLTKVCKALKEP